MAPPVKLTASMPVAVAAAELTFYIMSYIPVFTIGFRHLFPSLVCNAGLVFMLKYITERFFLVRRWQEAVKLSLYITAFYTFLMAPGIINSFMGVLYTLYLASHVFIIIWVMLVTLVYVKY